MAKPIYVELGMYIIVAEPISIAYFINPFHQSVFVYVHPSTVSMQQLGKNVTATINIHAATEELLDMSFSMQLMSYQGI
jgi:hypothetical protein